MFLQVIKFKNLLNLSNDLVTHEFVPKVQMNFAPGKYFFVKLKISSERLPVGCNCWFVGFAVRVTPECLMFLEGFK